MTLFEQLQILQTRHQIRSTLVIAHKGTAGFEEQVDLLNDISEQIEDLIELIEAEYQEPTNQELVEAFLNPKLD